MVYRPRTKLKLARKAKRCPKCGKLAVRCCRFDGQPDSLNWEARKEFEDEQEANQECAVSAARGS